MEEEMKDEKETIGGSDKEDVDDPKNYVHMENGAGALLRAKRAVEHVMKIKDRQFIDLKENDNVFVLYDYCNTKTKERALIFLIEEARYMCMTKEFDADFEVVFAGTYQHKTTKSIFDGVDNDDVHELSDPGLPKKK